METEAEASGGGGGGGGGGAGACAGAGGGAGVPLALAVGEGDEGEGETATLGLPAGLCAVDALLQAATAKTSNKQHNALHPLTAEHATPLHLPTARAPRRGPRPVRSVAVATVGLWGWA